MWKALIKAIKAAGYTGKDNDLDAVVAFVDEKFDGQVEVGGKAVDLKAEHAKAYPAKAKLDITSDANEIEIERKAQERVAQIVAEQDDLDGKSKRGSKALAVEAGATGVKVGKDRLEDDPCLGYPAAKECGFGYYLADVAKAATAVKAGKLRDIPERLSKAQAILETKDGQGLNESNDNEGGYLLVPDHRTELLQKTHETGVIFGKARQIPMGNKVVTFPTVAETSRVNGSRMGGITVYRVDEGTAPSGSKPKFGKVQLTAHKVAGLGYITEELLEDSPMTLSVYADLFAQELAFVADDDCVRGVGGGSPLGWLNAPCTVSIAKETGQAAATITKENIDKMWARGYGRSRANMVWFINQDCEPQLDNLNMGIGTGGVPVYLPPGGLSDTPYARLKGRPVITIEQASTCGTVGDINLVDMSQYLFGTRGGMKSATSMHVAFTTEEQAFRVTWRYDGQPWWNSALTPFKGSATLSPFVTLATRV